MVSMIIPTMWIPSFFCEAIKEYLLSSIIDEIIIIDNNPQSRPLLPIDNKLIVLTKNTNIYVNPSWNWGVSIAKNENILIINDDLFIKDIDSIMTKLLESNFDLVGLNLNDVNSSNGIIIREKKDYMGEGFGCFLFLKKKNYVIIPDDLKVWYGDRILFENNKNIGEIHFDNCIIEISKTVRSSNEIKKILHEDRINYSKYKVRNNK
jgi:hypothetical protein